MRLAEILGAPFGGAATMEQTQDWLRKNTIRSASEQARRERALRRSEMYTDNGHRHMEAYIDSVFSHHDVKQKRKSWISKANYINVTKRIIHEVATLYRAPAVRTVADVEGNERYKQLCIDIGMNQVMLKAQRLANLHRSLFVMPRVVNWDGAPTPRIELIEPQNFFAVADPMEPKRMACFVYDIASAPIEIIGKRGPKYRVITDADMFLVDSDGFIVDGSLEPNPLGFIPGTLIAMDPPSDALLDTTTGEDIIAAHLSVWFENINLLKESKSATKQPVVQGDATMMPRKQAADSEVAIEAPDGVMLTTLDLSMDLSMFRATADHILERCASNHGIPPAILHHAGATSGYEIELRHIGIRERRTEQESLFRLHERKIARVLSELCKVSAPQYAFDMDGWSINFGDVQVPLSASEQLTVFEGKRRLGLTDTVEEIMRIDPDMSEEQAAERLMGHIEVETLRNYLMRDMAAAQGSTAAPMELTNVDDVEVMQ